MSSNQKARHNNKSGRHNNRQNNRNRNQNNRSRKGPGKKQQQQPLTATKQIDSNGPGGKIRGNVKQLYDKYKVLAHENKTKDATDSEAYSQYAHHYYTLYSEFAAAEAAQQLEQEKEKERKKQEAAESQSNIVTLMDSDAKEDGKTDASAGEDIESKQDADTDDQSEKAASHKKKPRSRKKNDNLAPELPLEPSEGAQKPKRTRKTKKASDKIEEVAE